MEYKIRKSKFNVFVLSLIPGLGHMYLGLIKQGLELMGIFFGTIFIADFVGIGALHYLCPILIFYSIFDALSKREMDFDDKEAHCDIVNWFLKRSDLPRISTKVVGIIIVVIGVILAMNNFLPMAFQYLGIQDYTYFYHMLKTGFFAILFIIGGLYIAFRKPKNVAYDSVEYETIENDKEEN